MISASATRVRLNGADVSSSLTLSADGPTITGSLPGSVLVSNTTYRAQIELSDVTGTKKSTNTFWFDTFSDAFLLNGSVKVIEAEDYNYDGGVFQLEPIPVSGLDTNGVQVNGNDAGITTRVGFRILTTPNRAASSTPSLQNTAPWTEFRLPRDPIQACLAMRQEISTIQ